MKRKSIFRWFLILALFAAAGLGVQRILISEGVELPPGLLSPFTSLAHLFAPTAARPAEPAGEYVIISPKPGRLSAKDRDELASEARSLAPASPNWETETNQPRPARRKARPFHGHR